MLPEGLEEIGADAFMHCVNLTSVSLPDTLVRIGDGAFYNCGSLTDITLPESVKTIENAAFLRCKRLADENGFLIMKDVLFGYFGNLSEVAVPNGVTEISG